MGRGWAQRWSLTPSKPLRNRAADSALLSGRWGACVLETQPVSTAIFVVFKNTKYFH